jgi:hypothetical protein
MIELLNSWGSVPVCSQIRRFAGASSRIGTGIVYLSGFVYLTMAPEWPALTGSRRLATLAGHATTRLGTGK